MRKAFILATLMVLATNSFCQNNKSTEDKVDEIRELFRDIIKNKISYNTYNISTSYDGMVRDDTIFFESKELKLIRCSEGSEFTSDVSEYYYHKGKIFFIYVRNLSEGHWSIKPTPYTITEYRYYFDENENIIKILEKIKKGEDLGNIDKIMGSVKNEEINIQQHTKYINALETGRSYKIVFNKLQKIL